LVVHLPLASFPKISRALFFRLDLCLLVFQFSINLINQGSTCLDKSETMALIVTPPHPQTFQTLRPRPALPSRFPSSSTSPPNSHASSTSSVSFYSYPKSTNSRITTTTTRSRTSRLVVRASTSPVSPNISEILGDATIFTATGDPVMFKDLWDQTEVCLHIS
jgi:hypothetical protein